MARAGCVTVICMTTRERTEFENLTTSRESLLGMSKSREPIAYNIHPDLGNREDEHTLRGHSNDTNIPVIHHQLLQRSPLPSLAIR